MSFTGVLSKSIDGPSNTNYRKNMAQDVYGMYQAKFAMFCGEKVPSVSSARLRAAAIKSPFGCRSRVAYALRQSQVVLFAAEDNT